MPPQQESQQQDTRFLEQRGLWVEGVRDPRSGEQFFVSGPRAPLDDEIRRLIGGSPVEGFAIAPTLSALNQMAAPTGGERFLEGLGSGVEETGSTGFMGTRPFAIEQIPETISALWGAGPAGLIRALASQQVETGARGLDATVAPFTEGERPNPFRVAQLPAALVPLLGPAVANEVLEPLAQAADPGQENVSGQLGAALGGTLGLGISAITPGLGVFPLLRRGMGSLRAAASQPVGTGNLGPGLFGIPQLGSRGIEMAGRAAGERLGGQPGSTGQTPFSLGQLPGAGGVTRFVEAFVSRTPGGRPVFARFATDQARAFIDREVNGLVEGIAQAPGPRLNISERIQQGVDRIIDDLKEASRANYAKFEETLAARSPVQAFLPGRPQLQPGQILADVSEGAKVARKVVERFQQVADLTRRPEIVQMLNDVRGLIEADNAGQQIPVSVLIDARTSLLKLARRVDNPLASVQGKVINDIFDPINKSIEDALRNAGADDQLLRAWRQAADSTKRMHEVVGDSLIEAISQQRNPALIARMIPKETTSRQDLANLRDLMVGRGDRELWDQTRALVLVDRLNRKVAGESIIPVGEGGQALRVNLDPDVPPRVSANGFQAVVEGIPEDLRGVLLGADEIQEFQRLINTARTIADSKEEVARLVGSGVSAGILTGAAVSGAGAITGRIGLGQAAAGIAVLPGFNLSSKITAKIMTNPALAKSLNAFLIAGPAAGAVLGSAISQELLKALDQEELQELIAANGIAPDQLQPEVARAAFGQPPLLPVMQFLTGAATGPPGLGQGRR